MWQTSKLWGNILARNVHSQRFFRCGMMIQIFWVLSMIFPGLVPTFPGSMACRHSWMTDTRPGLQGSALRISTWLLKRCQLCRRLTLDKASNFLSVQGMGAMQNHKPLTNPDWKYMALVRPKLEPQLQLAWLLAPGIEGMPAHWLEKRNEDMVVGFVNGRYPQFVGILVRQFWVKPCILVRHTHMIHISG